MTAAPQPSIPTDRVHSLHSRIERSNAPPVAAASPLHLVDTEVLPKVWLRDISLSYQNGNGSRLLALDHIDLKIQPGEFLCIVGPSGCGKSTLLHLIAGLHGPISGSVLVNNCIVEGTGTDRILIFQELGLFPWLTVKQNVEFGMKMKGVTKAERREKTAHYLRMCTCRNSRTATFISFRAECGSEWRWPGLWPLNPMSC